MGDGAILDYLSGKDYDIALMTTFNFEIEFFERFVLNQLYDHNIRKISLFVDAKELSKAVMNGESSYIGRKYFVTPIEITASFHPKVYLLLGSKKARLIVGSANLTTTGMKSNNEIYNVFDYDEKNEENLSLIHSAVNFFFDIHEIYDTENDLFAEIRDIGYLSKDASGYETHFLSSLQKPIMDQIEELIQEEVSAIDIAVPYYDSELLALKEMIRRFPHANITLYLQNKTSTFNVEYNQKFNIIHEDNIYPFNQCICNHSNSFYHGKVIRFHTSKNSYILYGSANCTLSALLYSAKQSGNVECDILEVGTSDEFDYFFLNFEIEYPEILEHQTMIFEKLADTNFHLKSIEDDIILKLNLTYQKKIEDISISIGENTLEYEYAKDTLTVFFPLEIVSHLGALFDVLIRYNEKEEVIRCWYNHIQDIALFREVSNEKSVTKIKVPDEGTLYMEDEELIIRAMIDDPREIEQMNHQMRKQKSAEDDLEELEGEVFQIDEDIPHDYVRKYKEYEHVNYCLRQLAHHYFSGLRNSIVKVGDGVFGNARSNKEDSLLYKKKNIRNATNPEKRFERLVKSKINDLLNPYWYARKTYAEYKSLVGFFFSIFDKYKYQEKIEDIFLDSYVIETKFQLLEVLLSFANEDIDDYQEDNIVMALMIIIEADYINSKHQQIDYKIETKNREMLKRIDQLYHLRDSFKPYLADAIEIINTRTKEIAEELRLRDEQGIDTENYCIRDIISYNYAIDIIERLYGYKTDTELLELIKRFYGHDCEIKKEEGFIRVSVDVFEVGKYMNREDVSFKMMLKEIKNYSKNVSNIDCLEAVIDIEKEVGLQKIEYRIDINTNRMNRKMYYSNIPTREDECVIKMIS